MGDGGIVTRATKAIVGERGPEAIIPLERLGIGQQSAPANITINVQVSPLSNPAEVGAAVVDALKAYERRNGVLPLRVA
jgi:phage-related minor tail protein